jgi:multiple sugar transport system ATP-binding protein
MAAIALEHVRKVFPGGAVAVADLSLVVADGERLALVGPSGSGKSTVLRLIAGLDEATAGRVRIDGQDVTSVPPEARDLAMVFQNYALYPHKTVRENLAFGLRMRRATKADIEARVRATADSLGLGGLLDRRPAELSGGQRQRVALGRAIARNPRAFLFDEPLSNLDPALRGGTRAELLELHGRLGATMVYVTHDQEEAMTLGQRIAVLHDGLLEQVATPATLYERPANLFVATFIGSPAMNLLEGAQAAAIADQPARSALEAGEVTTLGVRPHDLSLVEPASAPLTGTIDIVERLGHASHVRVRLDGPDGPAGVTRVIAVVPADASCEAGAKTGLAARSGRLHAFGPDGRRREPGPRAGGGARPQP